MPRTAHNDYLEFVAEVGVLGLSLLGLMVLMSFAAALRAQASLIHFASRA